MIIKRIKYAIMIDDDITFVYHVFNKLNQIEIPIKGFSIKWDS
jgi:hypothetical protein